MANPEYETLVKCTKVLVSEIANNYEDIAQALFAAELIPDSILQRRKLQIIDKEKASEIIRCIRGRVQHFPEDFQKFLDVLKEPGLGSQILIERLENKHGTS